MARRRLTSTIGSVASVWRDPNAEPEEPEELRELRVTCGWCDDFDETGMIEDIRARFRAHLHERHPEVDPNPPRGRRKPDTRKA